MAKAHGKKARVYITGVDLSNYLRSAGTGAEQDLAESSGLAQDDKTFAVGMQGGKLSLDGMFGADSAGGTSQIADVLEEVFGVSELHAIHLPQGDGFGNRAKLFSGKQSSVEITTPYSDVGKISGEATSDIGIKSGLVHHASGKEVASGNSAELDAGAASANGGLAIVQVFDVSGGGANTLTVKIQDSPDDSVWADLITFTATRAGEFAEARVLAAGSAVDRYTRCLWTLSGGDATFHASFARIP